MSEPVVQEEPTSPTNAPDQPEVSPAQALKAKAVEKVSALSEGEDIYVPVVNSNYLPEGIVRLEGWVPPLNGGILEDQLIIGQKIALEDDPLNKLESGPHEDNDWVDPTPAPEEPEEPPVDPEPEAISPTESGTSQDASSGNPDTTSPSNETSPSGANTTGLGTDSVAPSTSDTGTTQNTTQTESNPFA